jgi:hypothetical protein
MMGVVVFFMGWFGYGHGWRFCVQRFVSSISLHKLSLMGLGASQERDPSFYIETFRVYQKT